MIAERFNCITHVKYELKNGGEIEDMEILQELINIKMVKEIFQTH